MAKKSRRFSEKMFGEKRSGRPLIGITMRHDLDTERFYLSREYSEAVAAAGGAPVHLSLIPERELIGEIMNRLDGILLPGSASDVDPLLYGSEPHRMLGVVHPLRDQTDRLILAEAEKRGMPLLAICYGMQAWNAYRGGTLIQDIASQMPEAIKHEQGALRARRSHRIRILDGSLLGEFANNEGALVNSHHHQAIERVGQDLRASAWTADGLVEAVENTREGQWGIGVQWHPEVDWRGDELSEAIFGNFVIAAREFMSEQRGETLLSVR